MAKNLIIQFIIGCGIFLFCQSCSHHEIEIERELGKNIKNGKLCFAAIDIGPHWDSLLIVSPYDHGFESLVKMGKADEKVIKSHTMNDGICTVLFLDKGNLAAYGFVSRNTFDFTTIKRKKCGKNENFAVRNKKVYNSED